ncbi:RNA methyltransferase, RsmE family [Prevotella sp. BV3P1]|uniref:16S rRNA (uracil(1498)-N(3))-methyltransferase n=1 Tax=Prevotellaceae TaxID=171552 RepID=UPI0003B808B7|nr:MULTISPECIES: 16S rRNA (uracil(1498)-N(3))-methyltransferase [Prevotellaceae]ERT58111.1 RNA methyltransferase, RsmE family [Prevotella sp. BV3P1]KGF40380.1 16S rRNA methyltransferase [Hoylesella buccalis DNF00985]
MKEARYFYVPDAAHVTELPPEEARHAVSVLRLKAGDEIFLMDGMGTFYQANVTLAATKHCMYDIVKTLPQQKTWKGHVHLAIAPTKMMDRMEWMLEKMTEVGFDEITFLNCRYSERKQLRIDRLEKIVIAAMKQSRKAWKPVVNPVMPFQDFVNQQREGGLYIAHCYTEIARKDFLNEIQQAGNQQDITILVGPEGDFSIDEVNQALEKVFSSVSLGQNRLRTETAGLVSIVMSQMVKRIL